MSGWYAKRAPDGADKAVIAVTLLAVLLVAAMPVALLAAVIMMALGHVIGGLALFGGSVLAAATAVALAGMSGMRRLRKLLSRASVHAAPLDPNQHTDVAVNRPEFLAHPVMCERPTGRHVCERSSQLRLRRVAGGRVGA
jgi:hypothetical protein